MNLYLGIDTSCYTTSVCLLGDDGRVVQDERRILTVPSGGRGLSQSHMVYQHTRNLPELMERLRPALKGNRIGAIGVTNQPRRREDSYMPAFLAGLGCARSLAAMLQVPLYPISHQENHLLAALRPLGTVPEASFTGLHLSGGTTDLLHAVADEEGLSISRIGGTSDISAGQFIDRVGVALGFPFPAGVHLDAMARKGSMDIKGSRVFCRNGEISYSGPESQAQRQIARGTADCCAMSCWTLRTVWNGLQELLDTGLSGGMDKLVAVGGVMSNGFLRSQLQRYASRHHVQVILAPDGYSADNASGAAFWAFWKERGRS